MIAVKGWSGKLKTPGAVNWKGLGVLILTRHWELTKPLEKPKQ